jgi:glycosyltransferase involved in cell wall biosynthesis
VRVLHVLTRAYRRGAETFGVTLHEELLAVGMDSRVCALAPAPPGHPVLDVAVLGPSPRAPRTLVALRRAARGVDVVVAHGSTTLPACRLAQLRHRTPFVYVNIGDPLHWAASPARRLRVRWMLGGATAVAAITPAAADRLVRHVGVDPRKVVLTGNGRRASDFEPPSRDETSWLRHRFAVPSGAPVAAVVAALSPEKRVDVAIRAAAAIPDLHVLIAGEGQLRAQLERLAAREAPGRVRFLGSMRDVRSVYAAADVLLLTSDTEGLPGVLVEAGLAGLPAVATDVGFVSDVVADGRTGRLVSTVDAETVTRGLEEAIEHRIPWGQEARARCLEEYELSVVVTRWMSLLRRVTAGDHARRR